MRQISSLQPPVPTLFGLAIRSVRFDRAVALLADAADRREGPARVVLTPNVDNVVRLERDQDFKQRYVQADFMFADGMPIVWASRWLGHPLPERVTGADLFVALCQVAVRQHWKIFVLGGRPGTEDFLLTRFGACYPGLDIEIFCPSMSFDPLGEEGTAAAERIRACAPRIVFVCLGMPKQELWSFRFADSLPGGVVMCVGAAMEFALGLRSRAPAWVQRSGVEWLWRLLSNPRRLWRRYLVDDPYFLVLFWREWRRFRLSGQGEA